MSRRAERLVVALGHHPSEDVPGDLLIYLNRLSDFLFVLARAITDAPAWRTSPGMGFERRDGPTAYLLEERPQGRGAGPIGCSMRFGRRNRPGPADRPSPFLGTTSTPTATFSRERGRTTGISSRA